MDFLDLVYSGLESNPDNYEKLPHVPNASMVPAPPSAPPAQAGSASILDMLQRALAPATATAPAPQADTSQLGPLALLQFAAQVAQPRAKGQSTLGKILESGASAANQYMNNKKQAEDLAAQREKDRKHSMLQDEQIKAAKLAVVDKAQGIQRDEEKRPLELEALRGRIAAAKSEEEKNALQVRLAKIKEKYADQAEKAAIAEREAKTQDEKASAALKHAQAKYHLRHAELLHNEIEAKRKIGTAPRAETFKAEEGMPGEPAYMQGNLGTRYRLPMDPAGAEMYADRQVQALDRMGKFKNRQEREAKKREIFEDMVKGQEPPKATTTPAAPGAAPTPAATPAAAPTPGADPDLAAALRQSSQSGKGMIYQDPSGQLHYIIAGKEVPKAEYEARKKKPAAPAATPAAPRRDPNAPGQFNGQTIYPTGP